MKYTIKKGHQCWQPHSIFPSVLSDFNELIWTVTPHASMEFDYEYEGELDADWADWKKIGGISLVNWKNLQNLFVKNKDAIMMAHRWNPTIGVHEFAVYENDRGKNIAYERPDQLLRTIAGTRISMKLVKVHARRYKAFLYVTSNGPDSVNSFIINTRQVFTMYSLINPWYGGANNAPGPWGGAAPRDMEMEIQFGKS